jgi:hypothetical protein
MRPQPLAAVAGHDLSIQNFQGIRAAGHEEILLTPACSRCGTLGGDGIFASALLRNHAAE